MEKMIEDWVNRVSLDRGWPVLKGAPSLAAFRKSLLLALLSLIHTFSAASLILSWGQSNFMASAFKVRSAMWEIEWGIACFLGVLHLGQSSLCAGRIMIESMSIGREKRHLGQYQGLAERSLLTISCRDVLQPLSSRAHSDRHWVVE